MLEHPWGLMAACKHRECGKDFPVEYEGHQQVFETEEDALIAFKETKVRDMVLLARVVQAALGEMTGSMPRVPETHPRLLKCPYCLRTTIYNAEELFVREMTDFQVGIQ